jgi:hypothetical protein
MRRAAALLVLLTGPAFADPVKLVGADIKSALADVSLYADGEIEQLFQVNGLTIYIERGSSSQGWWKVEGDQYCSQWPPSSTWACYDVTREGEVITFVSASGKSYPMRKTK